MFDKIAGSKWKHVVMFVTVFAFVATSIVAILVYKLSGDINGVAEVNGREIPFYEFNYSYQMAARNLELQNIDPVSMKKEIVKQVVENLIETELLYQEAEKEGIAATAEQVKREILNIPAFQVNGKFDREVYIQTINSLGLSPEAFEEILRKDLSANHIRAIMLSSVYLSDDELSTFTRKQLTKVSGDVTLIKPKDPVITDSQALQYYNQHKKEYSSKQDKKVAVYRISIQKLGQEKAEAVAKEAFSKLKSGQSPSEDVEMVVEDQVENIKSRQDIDSQVLSAIDSISAEKNILFIKTPNMYYILSYRGEVVQEAPFESVKQSIIQKLKSEENQKNIEKLHNSNLSLSELLRDNISVNEKVDNSTIQEVVVRYGIKPDDIPKITNLKLGQTSKQINVRDGVLFFTLRGIQEADKQQMEEMKKSIIPLVKNQKFNNIYQMYVDKLKEKAKIKLNKRILEDG